MKNPCYKCELRAIGCHSHCPKTPSYDDWVKWNDSRREIMKRVRKDNSEYCRSLKNLDKFRR